MTLGGWKRKRRRKNPFIDMNALLGNLDGEYMSSAKSEKEQESKAPGQILNNQ